ncbi:ATP-binding protein [Eubacterium callanderi]|nr:ATP-binding protein [Eubacterium callanderi]MBU5305701.1 ATP-binding protein [Eubacterium callanderi]WPK67536.1 Serine-protein kinase RsbW [Eubacterium callanderi]WPK71834.1 Serine-protein kinase RsbW [Eubacterium callanderi]SFP34605.1 Anti-sigma regulatory factor (Ser/Thr protein kinase) [Eubacterium callanderi]
MDRCNVTATSSGLQTLLSFTETWLSKTGISPEKQYDILIIVEELTVNIVNYAYDEIPGKITLSLELLDDGAILRLNLSDTGRPFNPLDYDDPKLSESIEERPVGGLGIFIIKSLADKLKYEYNNKQNQIIIEKRLT